MGAFSAKDNEGKDAVCAVGGERGGGGGEEGHNKANIDIKMLTLLSNLQARFFSLVGASPLPPPRSE